MKTATIVFDEYPDDEVTVILSPVPVATYFDIIEKANTLRFDPAEFRALFEQFAPFIDSWTFPEPTDADGLLAQDYNLGLAIIREWAREVRSVPLPLRLTPSDGTPSEAPPA